MLGVVYGSFFGQLMELDQPDPSGIPPLIVVAVKGLGLMLAILGLIGAVRRLESRADNPPAMRI